MSGFPRPYPESARPEFSGSIPLASFFNDCENNMSIEVPSDAQCSAMLAGKVYMLADFESVEYRKEIEVEADGFGKEREIRKSVNPRYSFLGYANEFFLDFLYKMIYQNSQLKITYYDDAITPNPEWVVDNIEMEDEEILDGLYRVRISYEYNGQDFGPFGLTGCCRPLYEEAPYEDPCPDGEQDPITINPDQLNFIPSTSGNVSNLNEIVIAADLSIWVIDWQGRGVCLTRTAGDFEITSSSRGWIIRNTLGERWRVRQNNAGNLYTEKL